MGSEMCIRDRQIDNASDVDALAALFTYTEQEDGSVTRPLGEFPVKA